MNRIDTCKKCLNRKYDKNEGVICGLKDKKPDFESECDKFDIDYRVAEVKDKTRPNLQRGKVAYIMVGLVTLFEIIALFSEYFQYSMLKAVNGGQQITEEMANRNDLRQQVIGILYLVVFIISVVTFLQWFRRGYFNLIQRTSRTTFTENWSVGCWFVPVISLYRPYQIMKEMWVSTTNLNKEADSSFYESSIGNLISWWWGLWVLLSYVGNFVMKSTLKAETVNEMITGSIASMISNILSVPLGILLYKIIKEYSEMEEKLRLNEIK